jgi:hypothetical protein
MYAPITHDQALPAPFTSEDIPHDLGIFVDMNTIDLVIGRHECSGLRITHGNLKREQVDLAEGSRRDQGVDRHSLMLLVIGHEMFDRSHHMGALDASNDGCGTAAGENRILGERLKASAAERTPLHVHGGAQQDMGSFGDRLLAHHVACLFEQGQVPCGTEGGSTREAGGGNAVEESRPSHSIGTIGEPKRRNAEPGNRLGMPKINSLERSVQFFLMEICLMQRLDARTGEKINLLSTSELRQNILRVKVPRERRRGQRIADLSHFLLLLMQY